MEMVVLLTVIKVFTEKEFLSTRVLVDFLKASGQKISLWSYRIRDDDDFSHGHSGKRSFKVVTL